MNRRRSQTFLLFLIIIMVLGLCLGGCGLRGQAREVDQLLVVQTLGYDPGPQGVLLSLSSAGTSPESPPVRLDGGGRSVSAALERIRAGTSEEELFCAHIGHLLIGEEAARQGIGPLLDYVCRSGNLRLSVPLYVLRGSEARSAVLGVGDEDFGVCDALDSVDADLRPRGDGHAPAASEILRDLARCGSALVCAVSLGPSAEEDESAEAAETPKTVIPDGYAVFRGGALCGFLDREQAVGVGLLTGNSGICEISVTDQAGLPVTLTLTGGRCTLEPRWEAGHLTALGVQAEAEALLAEGAAGSTELEYLQRMLEHSLSERLRQVLQLSKQWQADFLGLEGRLGRPEPDFAARWPSLPLTVCVSAKLIGTGGVEERP
ncbi:MAG: Ger(x)C family spore germination C-terminal domain-containing protein [Clostridia bacterium]